MGRCYIPGRRGGKTAPDVVFYNVVRDGCYLNGVMALQVSCSLGLGGLPSASTAGMDDVVEEIIKRNAQMVESVSIPDGKPQKANEQGSAATIMEDLERESEETALEGHEKAYKSAIIREGNFLVV